MKGPRVASCIPDPLGYSSNYVTEGGGECFAFHGGGGVVPAQGAWPISRLGYDVCTRIFLYIVYDFYQ